MLITKDSRGFALFEKTLEKEQICKRKYDTMEEVQRDVFEYRLKQMELKK